MFKINDMVEIECFKNGFPYLMPGQIVSMNSKYFWVCVGKGYQSPIWVINNFYLSNLERKQFVLAYISINQVRRRLRSFPKLVYGVH